MNDIFATDVAMVYRGSAPHPAHKGFAEAVGADLLSLDRYSLNWTGLTHSIPEEIINGLLLSEYDVYIAEGTRALYGSFSSQIAERKKLIYLAGDQALYKLQNSSYNHESILNTVISKFGMGGLKSIFNKYIDGFISVSDFSKQYTSEILSKKPSYVANPYIQPDIYKELGKTNPNMNNKIAVTVGTFSKYKGQDLLVDAWEQVRQEHPSARLKLVGNGYPPSLDNISGVDVLGYVDDLSKALESASLYVQPSRMDNFPVSVLEALRAGLPAVVTETTGNKTVVERLDEELVVKPTVDDIATGINNYFNVSQSMREDLSLIARSQGSTFDSESRKASFRLALQRLIDDIA